MSPFTKNALKRVEELRKAESGGHSIVLLSRSEIVCLLEGKSILDEMIEMKLRALKENGEILFVDAPGERPALERLDIQLPVSMLRPGPEAYESRAYDVVFCQIPDNFDHFEGRGFGLFGRLQCQHLDELLTSLQLLHSQLRFQRDGSYTITQIGSDRAWFGSSGQQLISRLRDRNRRYRVASVTKLHHSEEFAWCESTRFGLLMLTGRRVLSSGQLYDLNVELRLSGIPFDLEPLRTASRMLHLGWDELIPLTEPLVRDETPRPIHTLQPLKYLSVGDGIIGAAVVPNPLWTADPSRSGLELSASSVLFGRLGDWLAPNERVTSFELRRISIVRFRCGLAVDVHLGHSAGTRDTIADDD